MSRLGPSGRRWRRSLLALFVLAAFLVVLPVGAAHAHSGLVSSNPADRSVLAVAPDHAVLTFNEAVRPVSASFRLYDPAGKVRPVQVTAVDHTVQVQLPLALAEGSYVLSWRVVSADSHPISGALAFAVGRLSSTSIVSAEGTQPSDGRVAVAQLTAQVVAYLSLLAAVGLTMFEVLVLRSATAVNRARERVLLLAIATTIVAHAVTVPLTLLRGQALGLDRLLDETLLSASLGTAPALALALVILGCSFLVLRPVLSGPRSRTVLSTVGATLAVSSVLPVGHTRTVVPTPVVMAADLVHTLAGAVWFGGVIGLALFLGAARRAGAAAAGAAVIVRRFSGLAGVLVGALGVSGLILGVLILGSARSLLDTDYGRTLLVKLGLVAVVGLLAWWNKTHLVPAVARQQAPREQWRRLTGAVRDEVALLAAVICVTGLLVMQSPNAQQDPGPPPAGESTFRAALGEGAVQGSIAPARLGVNVIEFAVRDADGAAVAPPETPTVTATLPDQGLGPLVATVRPTTARGRYRARITLPASGRWQLAVSVQVDEFTKPAARLTVAVAP